MRRGHHRTARFTIFNCEVASLRRIPGDRLAKDPAATLAARDLYRAEMQRQVNGASWLSTNYETAGVFLSLLAGSPVWFLVFQAVALNLFMALCVAGQKRGYRRLVSRLETLPDRQ